MAPDWHEQQRVATGLPDAPDPNTISAFLRPSLMWIASGLSHFALCFGRRARQAELPDEPFLVELDAENHGFEAIYELGAKIGEGAFGKVYACCRRASSSTRQDLCVKIVATSGRHAGRVAMLPADEKLEIIRLFGRLKHQNIVEYHSFVQTQAALYVVMSQCLGPDLVDHMEGLREPLAMKSVRELSNQILRAIEAVHALGMMHRDVKLDNFRFKDPDATILQLLDFGAAKPTDRSPRAHTVTGTLLYAAPEVFDGVYSLSCDLWSAGVVLFFLVSGQLPFETSDVSMLRSMHRDPVLTGDCLFRGERWRKAPSGIKSLVRGLLTVDAAARLTAEAAVGHSWLAANSLQNEDDTEDLKIENLADGTSLRRVGSSKIDLVDLKRTYFVWNLAECGDEDTDTDEVK